jgi:hypothetical protein
MIKMSDEELNTYILGNNTKKFKRKAVLSRLKKKTGVNPKQMLSLWNPSCHYLGGGKEVDL